MGKRKYPGEEGMTGGWRLRRRDKKPRAPSTSRARTRPRALCAQSGSCVISE